MAACVIAVGIVIFFALTRTDVGREGLRLELERRFDQSLKGQLEIGRLSGNLLNRLTARNVVVRDAAGRMIIRADSVVLHPTWRDLLRRSFSAGRLTLIRPEIVLRRDKRGRWNLNEAFEPVAGSAGSRPWSFHSTGIAIVRGRVRTMSAAQAPRAVESGAVFDWTNAVFEDIDGRVIVDWEPKLKLIDVLEVNGRLDDVDVDVETFRGQLVIDEGGLALNEVHLRTPSSSIHINSSVSSLEALRREPSSAGIDVDLDHAVMDGGELSRIVPALSLDGRISAAGRLQGPLDRLVVENLIVERGASTVYVDGTVSGLPDSLDYKLAVRRGSIDWGDLSGLRPDAGLPSFDHLGTLAITGLSEGTVRFGGARRPLEWESTNVFRMDSEAGQLNVDAQLMLGREAGMHVDGTVNVVGIDTGRLLNRPALPSELTGSITLRAGGASLDEAGGQAVVALSSSSWASRQIDTLRLELRGTLRDFQGRLFASERGGRLAAELSADLTASEPYYRIDGRTVALDVGRLLLSESLSSALNAHFKVGGHGRTWTAFQGDVRLEVDPSTITYGDSTYDVPAHASHLLVRQTGAGPPRITLSGDVVEADVTGDVVLRPLSLLVRHWSAAVAGSAAEEFDKPYRLPLGTDTRAAPAPPGPVPGVPHDAAAAGVEPHELDVRLHVRRSDVLSALFPMLPALRTDLEAEGTLRLSPDRLELRAQLRADSLHVGSVRSRGVNAALSAAADGERVLASALTAELSAAASELRLGTQELMQPVLTGAYYDRGFDVSARAAPPGAAAPFRFRARMDLLADRNRLVVHEFQAGAGDQVWTAPDLNIVDFFREAVHVRGIRIERESDDAPAAAEYLQIEGTLSSAPEDTLFLHAEDLLMQHVGGVIGFAGDLGGRLDGRLAFTGLNRRPELTGTVVVEPMIYKNRLLGRMTVTSRYVPGAPDVALRAQLTPVAPVDTVLSVTENELALAGTFRLPALTRTPGARDPGSLDLNLTVHRADAFFFEHIFRDMVTDVDGYIDGTGHVGGDFRTPVFNADLAVRDARFHIPDFGLTYDAAGPVSVDRSGIHLDDVTLSDADDGEAVVGGSILFNAYRYFSFELHGSLDEIAIMNVPQSRELPFYGRIMASGDVRLTGPLSNALLQTANARTSPESDLYIPITESESTTDAGFIVFADSTGRVPNIEGLTRRQNLLARRPAGERPFLDGLDMDLNILAPEGSTVHLVIDPLLGDVINAVGGGRIQLVRDEGEFSTFGTFSVSSGDYLFTAGEVFFRRFLIDSGTITWDGDPLNAMLEISASYPTRASTDGLGLAEQNRRLIPLVIELGVSGRVATPIVDLSLSIDREDRNFIGGDEGLEALLNQSELAAQYATSVLLTNSFLLTASSDQFAQSRGQIAFNSLSQLVASQLNRYINYALPNVNLNLGVHGESAEDLDVTYGVALRLLDERLIIRGQGIYQNDQLRRQQQGVLDEFVVEVRLNPSVSVEVFYRREGDILNTESLNTSTTGAGLSYQTQFSTWGRLIDRLFGWLYAEDEDDEPDEDVVAGAGE